FGKPESAGRRRLGVTLTHRDSIESAIKDAINSASKITAHF
ncbi:MAG: phosphoribosylglycinamide formyltransferase 2, partial [Vibrio casei]